MLMAALAITLQLAASETLLQSSGWMPIEAIDHPFEAAMSTESPGDDRAWSLQDGAGVTAEVASKAFGIVDEGRGDTAANHPGRAAGFTDETVDLASKADVVPVGIAGRLVTGSTRREESNDDPETTGASA